MKVLCHHIYEYKKGLRNLVLHTMKTSELKDAEVILNRFGITYFVQPVTDAKVNIYFGKEQCVEIIKLFGKHSLTLFSHEEDFILGIMLGYDRMQQCERYIKRTAPVNCKIIDKTPLHALKEVV